MNTQTASSAAPVLLLPGWQNSGPGHWQTLWEANHGYTRVQQHDWMKPLRGDWIARLEDVLLDCPQPVVLVAHSLGCIAVAAWAAHSKNTKRVKGALLVAPPDVERDDVHQLLPNWAPISRDLLPFKAVAYASSDDPFCELDRARYFATAWGAEFIEAGRAGHINAESGLGDWPAGHAKVLRLLRDE